LLEKIVFLKYNMQTMDYINVFLSDLNIKENEFVEDILSEYEWKE